LNRIGRCVWIATISVSRFRRATSAATGGVAYAEQAPLKGGNMVKVIRTTLLVAAFVLTLAPAALAHTQTVAPPGLDAPVILNDPIARPWIQGHCQAQAPAVSGAASGGVATFSPTQELPCDPAILNPGGQSTGP
jgi:hypothetical protein